MLSRRTFGLVASLLLVTACADGDDRRDEMPDDPRAAASGAVASGDTGRVKAPSSQPVPELDSALAVELARFREGLPKRDSLAHALPSRDALAHEVIAAVGRADTAALLRLHVSRSEWAWLVYPDSRYARAPYRQRPDVTWMLLVERSNTGVNRLLTRRGGQPLRLRALQCPDSGEVEGRTRYWGRCTVTYATPDGRVATERLFGSILERDGRFKIASYANQF